MKTEEFEHQLTELRPELYRFTKKFTRSSEDSSDLVQETLAKAWRRRASFRENKNLIGWLYIIMRNTFVNQYRKNLQLKNVVSSDLGFKLSEDHYATKADESTHVEEVWKVIDSINPDLGKPFKMHLSGYKYEEIATALGIPMGTVKSRLFLARQEIRNQLPGYC